MSEQVEDRIRQLLENEVPRRRIVGQLVQQGYQRYVAQSLVDDVQSKMKGRVGEVEQRHQQAIAGITGLLTLVFLVDGLGLFTGATIQLFGGILTALLALGTGLTGLWLRTYYREKKELRFREIARWSAILLLPTGLAVILTTWLGLRWGGITGLQIMAIGRIGGLLAIGTIAHRAWSRELDDHSWGFVVVPAAIVVLLSGYHIFSVTAAVADTHDASFNNAVLEELEATAVVDRVGAAALVPAPSGDEAIVTALDGIGETGLAHWETVQDHSPRYLAARGHVCGGMFQQVRSRYTDPARRSIALYHAAMATRLPAENATVRQYLHDRCVSSGQQCNLTRSAIQDDIAELRDDAKETTALMADLTRTPVPDTDAMLVRSDCSRIPKSFARFTVDSLSCGPDGFQAAVSSSGSMPIDGPINATIGRPGEYAPLFDGRIGTADGWTDDRRFQAPASFQEDRIYRATFDMPDTGIQASAYCTGGDGFCEQCQGRNLTSLQAEQTYCSRGSGVMNVNMTLVNDGLTPIDASRDWVINMTVEQASVIRERRQIENVSMGALNEDRTGDLGLLEIDERENLTFTFGTAGIGTYHIELITSHRPPGIDSIRSQHRVFTLESSCTVGDI